jgi:hypothetical protein
MPRTIWSGAISFGLVTVPINVQSATEDHSIRFHQYHLEDMGRVRYRKVCELEDREVDQSEIGKGYELTRDRVIPITDEELSNLPLPTAKAIEIDAFVSLEDIDPIRMGAGYYLAAGGQVAAKPYKLLLALPPLVHPAFLIGDPPVDQRHLPRGLLLDDAADEPQHVETGQRGIVVHWVFLRAAPAYFALPRKSNKRPAVLSWTRTELARHSGT